MIDEKKVIEIKRQALEMCINAGIGHVSSAFSCAEVVCVLYYEVMRIDTKKPQWKDRDRLVMSKNHGSVITYPILEELDLIRKDEIFLKNGSHLGIHTKLGLDGVDFCGGSLGIGLGYACGIAYSAKLDKKDFLTFCIVGDGESYEGSIWEAIMFAGAKKLDNLVMILDRNQLCITDFTEKMLPLGSMKKKLEAFEWEAREINGHNLDAIRKSLADVRTRSGKPLCIIANTIKGRGIDFMENAPLWHGRAPQGEDAEMSRQELEEAYYGG